MTSLFDEFKDLYVKVSATRGNRPFQWIYAVDDAWLHPDGWSLELLGTKHKPVFPVALRGKSIVLDNNDAEVSAADNRVLRSTLDGNGGGTGDVETARRLIAFIEDPRRLAFDYGLCFCSFEYFVDHIDEINHRQNGVLFDLRHQLATASGAKAGSEEAGKRLWDEWVDKLDSYDLFGNHGFVDGMLGWYLHYAFKFGAIPGMPDGRLVGNNHVLIISSAISPKLGATASDGTPRDAISQYLQVQEAIWTSLTAADHTGRLEHLRPDDFTFSPLPKNFGPGENQFQTGLLVFNNSFSKSGNWSEVQKLLFADAAIMWAPGDGNYGHPEGPFPGIHWTNWLDAPTNDRIKPFYHSYETTEANVGVPSRKIQVRATEFVKILRSSHVHRYFDEFTTDVTGPVCIPSNPSIFWIATFIDFLHRLAPDGKDGRVRPRLMMRTVNDALVVQITLTTAGIVGMEREYSTGTKNCGAAYALRHLVRGIMALGTYRFEERELMLSKHDSCAWTLAVDGNVAVVNFSGPTLTLTLDPRNLAQGAS